MPDPTASDRRFSRPLLWAALSWAVAVGLALSALAYAERQRLVGELSAQSAVLHRLASQRADQHDAHLTALSAIFVAGGSARAELLLEVADTIRRFYGRIGAVAVVPFDPASPVIGTSPPISRADAEAIRNLASASTGAPRIAPSPSDGSHYLLVKRTPNTDAARHGLGLVIDASALIETDDPFWQMPATSRALSMPDGRLLAGTAERRGVVLKKPLGSASQPLILETSLAMGWQDLLPVRKSLLVAGLVTLLLTLLTLALRQRTRTVAAEAEARFRAHETQLAHASRVNAMGEMASGMAHELAQPLTAILSLGQAGRRLLAQGQAGRLGDLLPDIVLQAERATAILRQLQRWSRPASEPKSALSLNEAARNVARLFDPEARRLGAVISLDLGADPMLVDADPVQIEQVIFNLVRNGLEAQPAARVAIGTSHRDGRVILTVTDHGPGIPPDLRARIFEPFVTGKPGGTGLGLALCRRIVEEMDGEISLRADPGTTVFRVSLPASASSESQ